MRATLLGLLFAVVALAQKPLPKFMGREVTLVAPKLDDEQFFTEGKDKAAVCLEGPPARQCYTAPDKFGRFLTLEMVSIEKDQPALFFSVATNGVSGFGIHFALLRPGSGPNLENLLPWNLEVSAQSQRAFWEDPAISGAKIFITADAVWRREEGHFGEHRVLISAYLFKPRGYDNVEPYYQFEDQYLSVHSYDLTAVPPIDVLGAEKAEILARLRRVKAANR